MDIHTRLRGGRIEIRLGDSKHSLRMRDAEKLLHGLLSEIPTLPEHVKKITWDLVTKARGRIVQKYKHENGKIVTAGYQLEVWNGGPNWEATGQGFSKAVFTGPLRIVPLKAIQDGQEEWGGEVEIVEYIKDQLSYALARNEVKKDWYNEQAIETFGMGLVDVAKYVNKHGTLPPEKPKRCVALVRWYNRPQYVARYILYSYVEDEFPIPNRPDPTDELPVMSLKQTVNYLINTIYD